jgi:hypothetical protein
MEARAWSSGQGNFGISVGAQNRDQYFDRAWTEIEVEIDGRPYHIGITPGFWNKCPELRDSGNTVIRDWLHRQGVLEWPRGHPPRFELVALGGNRFRLEA